MGDGRLTDVAAGREVACAGLDVRGELTDDRQASRVGEGGKQPNLGVQVDGSSACHGGSISSVFDIDKTAIK